MTKALLLLCLPAAALASDVSGRWTLHESRFGESVGVARVELKVEGTKLTGSLNELTLSGTIVGDRVVFTAKRDNGDDRGTYDGRLDGDGMAGVVLHWGQEYKWTAQRSHFVPSEPKTHVFEPTQFYRHFSGDTPPVLRINPGDTIKTWTVDAGGVDAKGVRRSNGGNPLTGPFYVEDALPGDTLAIKFTRIRLNRDTAESGRRITSDALDGDYYRDAKYDDKFDSTWKLDREALVGVLAKADGRMKQFQVKLRPMMGCVGVAPQNRQTIRSGWLGPWGGNMDFNGLREGVTVYLPVMQEGALLYVGDGHAAQGDGELNGDALETSMDVELTVNLIRGESHGGPRFEDSEYLMASGIAGSLPEAMRQATTELAKWLEHEYKLSANESNVVLGTSIRYDIAEVVDPQVHVVAKVSKAALANLR
jgi:amidase